MLIWVDILGKWAYYAHYGRLSMYGRSFQRCATISGKVSRLPSPIRASSNSAQAAAFTLVELLVVMAVIAILAAILFPAFVAAKEQSAATTCVGNLKQLSTAFRMYTDDNSGSLPSPRKSYWPDSWAGAGSPGGTVHPENGQIWRYVHNERIYVCPSDRGRPASRVLTKAQRNSDEQMQDYARNMYPLSYSMNDTLYDYQRLSTLRADAVRRHSQILLLIHESRETIDDGAFSWPTDTVGSVGNPTEVHRGGSNLAYLDGHVV
ncbi:MAG: hypothetical protein A2Z18_10270, partial [Armatimonadetes bacterium RBG_16_58_9]